MKKIVTLLLCLLLTFSFSLSAFAAGQDDGMVLVTEKQGKKYFGEAVSKWGVHYSAADGSAEAFYRFTDIDLTGDGEMNICDLVKLSSANVDINGDGKSDSVDAKILRLAIIGITDYAERG